jgi:hypothetical protein
VATDDKVDHFGKYVTTSLSSLPDINTLRWQEIIQNITPEKSCCCRKHSHRTRLRIVKSNSSLHLHPSINYRQVLISVRHTFPVTPFVPNTSDDRPGHNIIQAAWGIATRTYLCNKLGNVIFFRIRRGIFYRGDS